MQIWIDRSLCGDASRFTDCEQCFCEGEPGRPCVCESKEDRSEVLTVFMQGDDRVLSIRPELRVLAGNDGWEQFVCVEP